METITRNKMMEIHRDINKIKKGTKGILIEFIIFWLIFIACLVVFLFCLKNNIIQNFDSLITKMEIVN